MKLKQLNIDDLSTDDVVRELGSSGSELRSYYGVLACPPCGQFYRKKVTSEANELLKSSITKAAVLREKNDYLGAVTILNEGFDLFLSLRDLPRENIYKPGVKLDFEAINVKDPLLETWEGIAKILVNENRQRNWQIYNVAKTLERFSETICRFQVYFGINKRYELPSEIKVDETLERMDSPVMNRLKQHVIEYTGAEFHKYMGLGPNIGNAIDLLNSQRHFLLNVGSVDLVKAMVARLDGYRDFATQKITLVENEVKIERENLALLEKADFHFINRLKRV